MTRRLSFDTCMTISPRLLVHTSAWSLQANHIQPLQGERGDPQDCSLCDAVVAVPKCVRFCTQSSRAFDAAQYLKRLVQPRLRFADERCAIHLVGRRQRQSLDEPHKARMLIG